MFEVTASAASTSIVDTSPAGSDDAEVDAEAVPAAVVGEGLLSLLDS